MSDRAISRLRRACSIQPAMAGVFLLLASTPAASVTSLLHDAEPNDAPHEAVDLSAPSGKDVLRIVGSLDGQDQDAYRLVVDEDEAGTRFDLQLTGRGGALTRIDIFDFTASADGRGNIPAELTSRPEAVFTLATQQGTRPVRADRLLLAPGVYIFGVSHSGGEGAYAFEISAHDARQVAVLDGDNSADSPQEVGTRGRPAAFWTRGESQFFFDVEGGEDGGPSYWDLEFQTPAGHPARVRLEAPGGETLIELDAGDGLPLLRRGLALSPGKYRLVSEMTSAAVQVLTVAPAAPRAGENREAEPNDRLPNVIEFGQEVSGTFEEDDRDWLEFEVTEADTGSKFDLAVTTAPGGQPELCLSNDGIDLAQCARSDGEGVAKFSDLGLPAGRFRLRMHARGDEPTPWRLAWTETGEVRPGEEIEPNDKPHLAGALHQRGFGRGRFIGREPDYWRFSVTGEPQLWRLQLQGEDLQELVLYDSGGKRIKGVAPGNATRARLDNVFLLPGEYVLEADGTDSDYMLRVLPLGPPPAGMELEPNDDYYNAAPLRFGQEYTGTLAESDDQDRYRFLLLGYERVRITVQPPVDGGIRGRLQVGDETSTISDIRQQNEPGKALDWDLFLPPGDYNLLLEPGKTSDAEYTVVMARGDYLESVSDREPNDNRDTAAPMPPDGRLAGRVGKTSASRDWYRVGPLEQPAAIELPGIKGLKLSLYEPDQPDESVLEWDRDAGIYRAGLEADAHYLLHIEGNGEYSFDLSAIAEDRSSGSETPVGVSVDVEQPVVQAHSRWQQRIAGKAVVTNTGTKPVGVELETHLTDQRWGLELEPAPGQVAPGASVTIPFSITIPPGAREDVPTQLSLAAGRGAGAAHATAAIDADIDAAPVDPEFHWPVPEELRGGFNAAASRFGAEPVASPDISADDIDDMAPLFDNMARVGRWTESRVWWSREREQWVQPTVRLAGYGPVPVRGFLINPTASLSPTGFLRDFAVAVSLDGENFEQVFEGTVQPLASEQAFVLDQAVPARFVRLMPLTSAFGETRNIRIGEFKVVAERGWRPWDHAPNLGDPAFGGHLVWAEPWLRGSAFDTSMLVENGDSSSMSTRGADGELVIGFDHGRAARVGAVSLLPLADAAPETQPGVVRVSVSDTTPLGPWAPAGEFEMTAGETRFELQSPTWARYVRFVFVPVERGRYLSLPDRIAVFETTSEAGADSILGEWGDASRHGPLEAESTPRFAGLAGPMAHRSRDAALALKPGQSRAGRALLDQYAAWFRLDVPADRNRLELSMTGQPTLEAAPRLYDADGEAARLYALEDTARTHRWEAWVEPGQRYYLEAFEPPRSVLFSWDTSGSVGAYLPLIRSALLSYAETIKPGRDEVNLLPFGYAAPLLQNWQGEPYPLRRMLAADPMETSSSAAETALAVAAGEMIGRPGKKAVLLLTDAATPTDATLWPALNRGRPQVFAMRLPSEGALGSNAFAYQDLMQDWAAVRGGHYHYVSSVAALQTAFDRTVAQLKRPVAFDVSVVYERVDDPSPATIAVTAGDESMNPRARGAVEIILDASGSMLKRMDGTRRIEIAKAAVRRTVEETLPDGIPLALRVYGHREAGSCRSDLEIPLSPLDKPAFLQQVDGIQAINLARTPIADSLAAVASDLAQADGRKLVILLTDGEETCDGDPAAAIARLQADGFDVRVNIVGFAIDDQEIKRQFTRWAELGGGQYLDAGEAGELEQAMRKALRIPFRVVDAAGETVAEGVVDGDSVQLPPGGYSVIVERADGNVVEEIDLAPGDDRTIELD